MKKESSKLRDSNFEEKQTCSIIRSFFLPEFSLQGSEFPLHLLWDERNITIRIESLFNLIKLKEIYNVDKNSLKIEENSLYITNFEKNGYVGLVFESIIHEKPRVEAPIRIIIRDDDGKEQIIEQKILLFRPHIVVYDVPNEIKLIETNDEIRLDKKILVKNVGEGTALVKFEISDKCDIVLKMPEETEKFIEQFSYKFSSKLEKVKREFPQYIETINGFEEFILDIIKGTFKIDREYVEKIQKMLENLEKAFQENEDFLRDIAEALISAYLSSVSLFTELRSFLEYLKSIVENKVILINSTSMIELKPGKNFLEGKIYINDLASNSYDPIKITTNIIVLSSQPVRIPLYEIFSWSGVKNG